MAVLLGGHRLERADANDRTGRRIRMVNLTNDDRREHDRRALEFQSRVLRTRRSTAWRWPARLHLPLDRGGARRPLGDVNWSIGGENVGVGARSESLEDAFMASKLHRENILRKSFDHMAVGIVRDDGAIWITVIFYGRAHRPTRNLPMREVPGHPTRDLLPRPLP
jgi:hypothetical protein